MCPPSISVCILLPKQRKNVGTVGGAIGVEGVAVEGRDDGRFTGRRTKKGVVEEGTLEDEMDEGIKEMPGENEAGAGGVFRKEEGGKEVGEIN